MTDVEVTIPSEEINRRAGVAASVNARSVEDASPADADASTVTGATSSIAGEDGVSIADGDPSANVATVDAAAPRLRTLAHDTPAALRRSLFPFVPPYIRFTIRSGDAKQLPRTIRRLLRWKNTKITPLVVKSVVRRSGFLLQDECKCWSGTWSNQIKSTAYKHFHDHQKFNHFPGTFHIGRKDNLWRNIQHMRTKHGEKKFDIMPATYVLPEDKGTFRTRYEKDKSEQYWIVKPPASYRGDGIKIVHKYQQIPKSVPLVVQRYVREPYLINGNKFDMRIYVLISSINPLQVYMYEEGLARFASVKYSPEPDTLEDRFMHLTNYSVNKLNVKYESNSDTGACKGHKWTLTSLWKFLEREHSVNVKEVWASITDLVIRTIISSEDNIFKMTNGSIKSKYNVYELFGFDVLLDKSLKPWLLEVNVSPSLHSSSQLDKEVKAKLMRDTFNIVGFHIPVSKSLSNEDLLQELQDQDNTLTVASFDNRIYTGSITNAERFKHFQFVSRGNRTDYIERILQELTPDDVRHLILYEDEQEACGMFIRIFPTQETYKYLKFFEKPRYYNLLLDAWESKHYADREEGRNLLRNLCENKMHLKVPRRTDKVKLIL